MFSMIWCFEYGWFCASWCWFFIFDWIGFWVISYSFRAVLLMVFFDGFFEYEYWKSDDVDLGCVVVVLSWFVLRRWVSMGGLLCVRGGFILSILGGVCYPLFSQKNFLKKFVGKKNVRRRPGENTVVHEKNCLKNPGSKKVTCPSHTGGNKK